MGNGSPWSNPHTHIAQEVQALAEFVSAIAPLSNPPAGKFKVTNLYVDENGKLVIEYDDHPA